MTVMVATLSEPLGLEQRVDEVDHQPHSHEAGEGIVEDHGEASSEPITSDGVADRQHEEDERDGEHDDVQHVDAPSDGRFGACSMCRRVTISTYVKNPQTHALFRRHYLSLIA